MNFAGGVVKRSASSAFAGYGGIFNVTPNGDHAGEPARHRSEQSLRRRIADRPSLRRHQRPERRHQGTRGHHHQQRRRRVGPRQRPLEPRFRRRRMRTLSAARASTAAATPTRTSSPRSTSRTPTCRRSPRSSRSPTGLVGRRSLRRRPGGQLRAHVSQPVERLRLQLEQTPLSIFDVIQAGSAAARRVDATSTASLALHADGAEALRARQRLLERRPRPSLVDVQYLDVSKPASPSVIGDVDVRQRLGVDAGGRARSRPSRSTTPRGSRSSPSAAGTSNAQQVHERRPARAVHDGRARRQRRPRTPRAGSSAASSSNGGSSRSATRRSPSSTTRTRPRRSRHERAHARPQRRQRAAAGGDHRRALERLVGQRRDDLGDARPSHRERGGDERQRHRRVGRPASTGVDAQVFQNGTLAYVVTDVQVPAPCCPGGQPCSRAQRRVLRLHAAGAGRRHVERRRQARAVGHPPSCPSATTAAGAGTGFATTTGTTARTSSRSAATRSPSAGGTRSTAPGPERDWSYIDSLDALFVVDVSNADAPTIASMTVTDDPQAWWGDMPGRRQHALHDALTSGSSRPDPSDPQGTVSTRCTTTSTRSTSPTARTRASARRSTSRAVLVGALQRGPV